MRSSLGTSSFYPSSVREMDNPIIMVAPSTAKPRKPGRREDPAAHYHESDSKAEGLSPGIIMGKIMGAIIPLCDRDKPYAI